ncbi:uncharacterized protein IUM83_07628 [Phytophthora cinnamomi]|uniref:uncharacterized protein n=1 Tax=Phytophthora cinnamomi TaxID=4785 RepID=UPI00355A6145|nr:hypothetical protein IUM83_07628 [Phytophthora cinnamomi]
MESRSAQDGGAVRRSGAFSGRQVPLEMGTLRVGGSGRPVPAVFSSGAARRSVTASLEAPAASATALSPRLTVEKPLPAERRAVEDCGSIAGRLVKVSVPSEKGDGALSSQCSFTSDSIQGNEDNDERICNAFT